MQSPELAPTPSLTPTARVILVDPERRVLLQRVESPDGAAFWHLPGGGLEPEEDFKMAASRSVLKGIDGRASLGPCVWVREHDHLYERYYVACAASAGVTPPRPDGRISEQRWWTEEEIRSAPDAFAPSRLASLLPGILKGNYPYQPIETGA